jgi:serine phosphatase RsbU (regulator of sigma subunit)
MGYEEATIDLRSGDVLVAFTDGVIEALNVDQEEFGEQRLKDLLRQIVRLPVQRSVAHGGRTAQLDQGRHNTTTSLVVMKVNQTMRPMGS